MNNSSNYDVEWRHPFSMDLNAFILQKKKKKIPSVSKRLFISCIHCTCMPSSIQTMHTPSYSGRTPVSRHLLSSLLWWELGTNSLITGPGEWLSFRRFTSKLSWEIYTLIAFYQRIQVLWNHAKYFSNASHTKWGLCFFFTPDLKLFQKHKLVCHGQLVAHHKINR